jgi:hypothetical protein
VKTRKCILWESIGINKRVNELTSRRIASDAAR